MLRLPDSWLWDFWLADDGRRYHLFYLFASRALEDEHRRHGQAAIGHAVSDDLWDWARVGDVVAASPAPAFDDVATWTQVHRSSETAWPIAARRWRRRSSCRALDANRKNRW